MNCLDRCGMELEAILSLLPQVAEEADASAQWVQANQKTVDYALSSIAHVAQGPLAKLEEVVSSRCGKIALMGSTPVVSDLWRGSVATFSKVDVDGIVFAWVHKGAMYYVEKDGNADNPKNAITFWLKTRSKNDE